MKLPTLIPGVLLRRYQRFLADVALQDGQVVTAHCPNTGSMQGCWQPGVRCEISAADNPKRKLAWTLERVDMGAGWIGVHTGRVNAVIAEAISLGRVAALRGSGHLEPEPRPQVAGFERSRLDLLLHHSNGARTYVEIKNTTLLDGAVVRFPDAATARGRKHLALLCALVRQGHRGVMLYAVNRPEGTCFGPAAGIDPAYAQALADAVQAGVEVLALRLIHSAQELCVGEPLPIRLTDRD